MKITIIGWYGTETIGDRAILAKLLCDIARLVPGSDVSIASMYPFITENTLIEDRELYIKVMRIPPAFISRICIINSRKPLEFRRNIIESDLVVVGGGPFDQIAPMHMIEYAFQLAKKKSIRTLIYGCGVNAIRKHEFVNSIASILNNSDCVIMRDKSSKDLLKLCLGSRAETYDIKYAIDPAVFTAIEYMQCNSQRFEKAKSPEKTLTINLRDFPSIYSVERSTINVNSNAIATLNESCLDMHALFIPMNYHDFGNDDRIIGIKASKQLNFESEMVHRPLSLAETMDSFMRAEYCIGMRFHAVVLQTVLNGNNYILNYTDPLFGKIPGFIDMIGGKEFYSNRIIHLQVEEGRSFNLTNDSFKYNTELLSAFSRIYTKALERILS